LFSGSIIIVQLTAKQAKPFLQVQDTVIHKITGTTLNDQSTLVGEVLSQTCGDHATSSTATNDNIVIAINIDSGKLVSGSHVEYTQVSEMENGEMRTCVFFKLEKNRGGLIGDLNSVDYPDSFLSIFFFFFLGELATI